MTKIPDKSYVQRVTPDMEPLWRSKGPRLRYLDVELTERCNNKCIHCYINQPPENDEIKNRELSTEKLKEIISEAASLGCMRVRFTGGEPLLRSDFEELYLFTRKMGITVLLFTNATLLTESMVALFCRIQPLSNIEVTLYGLEKKTYEEVSGVSGSFDAAMKGIERLRQKKVPFIVKGAVLPPNKKELDLFFKWAGEIEWMDSPPALSMFFDLRCHHDSEFKNNMIRKLRVSPEEGVEILCRRTDGYVNEMKEFCTKFLAEPSDRLFSCGSGNSGGCVGAFGSFQPCLLLKSPLTAYDISSGSLKDAITSFFPKIREMKATNQEYLEKCGRCFLKGLCEQCPAKSWIEHGTLDTPVNYLCDIAHYQARKIGLLKDNEKSWTIQDWRDRIENLTKDIE